MNALAGRVLAGCVARCCGLPQAAGRHTFGNRQDYAVGDFPSSVAIGDLDSDDLPDIAVTNRWDHDVTVLCGQSAGGLGERQDYSVGNVPGPIVVGHSKPPYKKWSFHKMKTKIGGPNFIRLPNGSLWGSGRLYGPDNKRTPVLARMTRTSYDPVLALPSGGDNSYPGLVWNPDDNLLWMSYYSSHEGKTSIYLAKIRFDR